ncbi:protein-lysine N-methyltransferase EEF2KMT [Aulostomus maculatus]
MTTHKRHGGLSNPRVRAQVTNGTIATARLTGAFLLSVSRKRSSSDVISDVLKQTCLHPLSRTFPPAVSFRRRFLSELVRRLDAAGCEPLDELYDTLAEVVGATEETEGYKSYFLPYGGAISLLENVAVISEGTTGLVTWDAALYLAEWALEHPHTFAGRSVLELGSGVGLTGIAICRTCSPSRYVFSDCHHSVLQRLRDNMQLNGLLEKTPPAVLVEELDWMAVTDEQMRAIGADVIIAADVVYDPAVAGRLVELLSRVLRESPTQVIICSAIRNPDTYSVFKQQLGNAGISHHVISGAVSCMFPHSRVSPIEMIQLSM